MQIAAGVAIAYRSRFARLAFGLWMAAALAAAIGGYLLIAPTGARPLAAILLETLGAPLAILFVRVELPEERSPADAAAALLVLALASAMQLPSAIVDSVRWLLHDSKPEVIAEFSVARAVTIVSVVLGLRAAIRLLGPSGGRRAVAVYAVVVIVGHVGMPLVALGFAFQNTSELGAWLIAQDLIAIALAFGTPLALGFYVARSREVDATARPTAAIATAWPALFMVPTLIAKCLVPDQPRDLDSEGLGGQIIGAVIVLLATQAIVTTAAAIATLRRDRGAPPAALVAAI